MSKKSIATKTQKNLAPNPLDGRVETTESGIWREMAKQIKTDCYRKPEPPKYCIIGQKSRNYDAKAIINEIHPNARAKRMQSPLFTYIRKECTAQQINMYAAGPITQDETKNNRNTYQ